VSFPLRHYTADEKQKMLEMRVEQLEKMVAALQKRIAELENAAKNTSPSK
jgi:uncharacterized protein YceH (UPF0502 family)